MKAEDVLNLREDAEQEVRDGLCGACSAIGCNDEDICGAFQADVKSMLEEWAQE